MSIATNSKEPWHPLKTALVSTALILGAYSSIVAGVDIKLTLKGDHEVPAVKSKGTGSAMITVGDDGAISGSVTTAGVKGTAAHIHEGAAGKSGPVAIPLTKEGDTYSVPKGAKLTAAQLSSFKEGNLYVNVHTAANPDGELRAQLKN